jgi:hypothetical protein
MQQNSPQFVRPLLRMGSIAFLAGVVIVIVSTLLHPSREDPGTTSVLAWIGFAVAIMTASAIAILQTDGIALKMAVDSWATAHAEEKDISFRVAEGIRWIEYGTNTIFRILHG